MVEEPGEPWWVFALFVLVFLGALAVVLVVT